MEDYYFEGTNASSTTLINTPPVWVSPPPPSRTELHISTCALGLVPNISSFSWDQGTSGYLGTTDVETEKADLPNHDRAIMELRRLSGLTWDHIARIFAVSRRSIHFWASGKAMKQEHEEKLYRLLNVIRKIDTGSASANRCALLSCDSEGRTALELLRDSAFDEVLRAIENTDTQRKRPKPIDSEEFKRRMIPASPVQLLDASQETLKNNVKPQKRIPVSQIRKKSRD